MTSVRSDEKTRPGLRGRRSAPACWWTRRTCTTSAPAVAHSYAARPWQPTRAQDLLHYLRATGLEPGLEGVVAQAGEDQILVDADGRRAAITRSVAETVSVTADPSPPPRVALPDQLVFGTQRYGR